MLFLSFALSGLVAVSAVVIPQRPPRLADVDSLTVPLTSTQVKATVEHAVFIAQDLNSAMNRIRSTIARTPLPATYDPAFDLARAFAHSKRTVESLPALSPDTDVQELYAPLVSVLDNSFMSLLDLKSRISESSAEHKRRASVRDAEQTGIHAYVTAVIRRLPGLECALSASILNDNTPAGLALEKVSEQLFSHISQGQC